MASTLVLSAAHHGATGYAASLLQAHESVSYIVTGAGPEHVPAELPTGWKLSHSTKLAHALIFSRQPVIIDSLPLWVRGVLDDQDLWGSSSAAVEALDSELEDLLVVYASLPHDVVAVSEEVGWCGETTSEREATYRVALGHVNTHFSAFSARVHLLLGGRVLDLSAMPSVLHAHSQAARV